MIFSLLIYASLNPLSRIFLKIVFCSLLLLLIFILHYCRLTQLAVQTDHVDLVAALNLTALSLSRTEAWSSVCGDASGDYVTIPFTSRNSV